MQSIRDEIRCYKTLERIILLVVYLSWREDEEDNLDARLAKYQRWEKVLWDSRDNNSYRGILIVLERDEVLSFLETYFGTKLKH